MYNVGELGDCFFLQFKDGASESNVLIDCGSFRNSGKSLSRMQAIATHIKKELKGKNLDLVIGTHQHNDHVSGFYHAEKIFTGMIDQVWLSWLDDPSDGMATQVYNEQKGLLSILKKIYDGAKSKGLAGGLTVVKDVLGFYAADGSGDPEIPAKGIALLKTLGKKKPRYMQPGEQTVIPGMNKSQVKAYILGPPRDRAHLFDKDPSKGESYDTGLAAATSVADKILSAVKLRTIPGGDHREEFQFPFPKDLKKNLKDLDISIQRLYKKRDDKWRTIDKEWLEEADALALYLDTYTNNSSLVVAFELVETGKVLLFAADAQTGNWLSWDKIKWTGTKKDFSTKKLMNNTVLYKVGHHGSHNATLVAAFEEMTHNELVAMIPVDKDDPNITKKNGWKMPAKNLYQRLKEKTNNRVLRMDDGYAEDCDPRKTGNKTGWGKVDFKPKIDPKKFYTEYKVEG